MEILINKFKQSKFVKPLTLIVGGTATAQIINFLFQPIISRLYSPGDFGIFGLFTSLISILCVVVTMTYDQSIIAVHDDNEGQSLMFGTIYISIGLSLILFILIIIFKNILMNVIKIESGDWLYFLPFNLMAVSLYMVASSYNYRLKKYQSIASSSITRVIALCFSQIILYYVGVGYMGLIIGNTVSLLFGCSKLVRNIIKANLYLKNANINQVISALKKNKNFPLYQMPTSFVNQFTSAAIAYVILALYLPTSLGIYSLVDRVLSLPISMVSSSARQLCIAQIAKNTNDIENIKTLFKKMVLTMGSIILVPFSILFLAGDPIFIFIFGKPWAGAGRYIRVLTLLYIIRFVVYPLSSVSIVFRKQRVIMFFQIALILSVIVSAIIANLMQITITSYLLLQSLIMSTIYVSQGVYCYCILENNKTINTIKEI